MRLAGSSIPELGSVVLGNSSLNPLFASVLIPFGLIILLIGSPSLKWFAIGSSIGVAACLGITAFTEPNLWLFGTGAMAQGYLLINSFLCLGLAYLASQKEAATSN